MTSIKERLVKLASSTGRIGATAGIVSLVSGMSLVTSSLNETQASEIVTGHAVKTNEEVNIAARIIDIDRSKLVHKNYLRAVEVLDAYTDKTSSDLKFDPSMFDGKEYPAPAAEPKGSVVLDDHKQNEVKAEEIKPEIQTSHDASPDTDELEDISKMIDTSSVESQDSTTEELADAGFDDNGLEALDKLVGSGSDNSQVKTVASVSGFAPASTKEVAKTVKHSAVGQSLLDDLAKNKSKSKSNFVQIDDKNFDEDCKPEDTAHDNHVKAETIPNEMNESDEVIDAKIQGERVVGQITFEIDIYYGTMTPAWLKQSGLKVTKQTSGTRIKGDQIEWDPVELTDEDIISAAAGEETFERANITTVEPRTVKPNSSNETVHINVLTNYDKVKAAAQKANSNTVKADENHQVNDSIVTEQITQPEVASAEVATDESYDESSQVEETQSTDEQIQHAASVADVHFVDVDTDTEETLNEFDELIEYASEEEYTSKVESIIDARGISESYRVIDARIKDTNIVTRIIKRVNVNEASTAQVTNDSNERESNSNENVVKQLNANPYQIKAVADSKLGSIQSLSNRAEYSKYTSFNDFDSALLDKRIISDIVFSISNGSFDYNSSNKVLQPSQNVVKLLELNKRFEDRLLYRLNDFRRSVGLSELSSQSMTLEQDRMLASHSIYNYLAANHSSSITDSNMMSQLGLIQSETMQPAHHLKIAGQYLTPEAAADSMYRAILSEAASYANGDGGQTGHLEQLLDPNNRTIAAAMFVGDYSYNHQTAMSDYTISTTLQYYKD